MQNPLLANSSALEVSDTCTDNCDISAENLAVAECVLRILDNSIERLQIAMIIPSFLNDQELLKQCFNKTQLQKCIKYYNDYMNHAELMQGTNKQQLHIALIEFIDLFCENRRLKDIIPDHVGKIPEVQMELINALIALRKIADSQLKTTAIIEMRREKVIHRIYQDNENTIQNLSKQKRQLRDQEINLRWKLAAKQALIKKYEDDLAIRKWDNNLKIKQEILKSSHIIRDFNTKSLSKQEHLKEDVEKAEALYEKGLKLNLKTEKEIRDEKNKLLIQLQGLIKKYDQNIGEKIKENADLQIAYDKQRQAMDEFLVGYNLQEEEYSQLAQKKRDEETAEFEQKLWFFMASRAAKIIQQVWRRYLRAQRKLTKGQGKGKNKKKKK